MATGAGNYNSQPAPQSLSLNSPPSSSPPPPHRPCQQTLGCVPRVTLLEAGSGLVRRACGPRARNSPRRPAPAPGPRPPSPGGAPPPPAARTACGIEESRARRPEPSGGGGTRGFLGEGLGAWRRGGRCRRGVGARPKENWATHQEESSVRTS